MAIHGLRRNLVLGEQDLGIRGAVSPRLNMFPSPLPLGHCPGWHASVLSTLSFWHSITPFASLPLNICPKGVDALAIFVPCSALQLLSAVLRSSLSLVSQLLDTSSRLLG